LHTASAQSPGVIGRAGRGKSDQSRENPSADSRRDAQIRARGRQPFPRARAREAISPQTIFKESFMPFPIHTVEAPDGGILNYFDRIVIGGQLGIANAAGGGAGESVTTPVSFPSLPPNYAVIVTPSQAAAVSVTDKSWTGFNVTLTPLSGTLEAGTFDVIVVG
jgi:hypothetical protein